MSKVGENRLLEALCHSYLCRALTALGRFQEAIACHQQALAVAHQSGKPCRD